MAMTSAAVNAVRDYLAYDALKSFRFLFFDYEPDLQFSPQVQEEVARQEAAFARKHGGDHWLACVYNRSVLEHSSRRIMNIEREVEVTLEDGSTELVPDSMYKMRVVQLRMGFQFISPSPEYLEELEERFLVKGLAETLSAQVTLNEKPYTFDVNILEFEPERFGHMDVREARFSIFQTNAVLHYPVVVLEHTIGSLRYIGLSVYVRMGIGNDVEVFSTEIE